MARKSDTDQSADRPTGTWCVFESIAADGSWTVGYCPGPLDPSLVMVIETGLTEDQAEKVAVRHTKSMIARRMKNEDW